MFGYTPSEARNHGQDRLPPIPPGDIDAVGSVARFRDLLRASYDLGLAGVVAVDIADAGIRQQQGADGSACLVAFTVRVVSII